MATLWNNHSVIVLPGDWRNNKAVLNAFVDDSGSGGDSPWYVLSGVVSTIEKWTEFSAEWALVCKSDPPIEYLKMSEASAQSGQFANFSKAEREAKLDALATLIDRHVLFSKNVMVEQEPFDRILKAEEATESRLGIYHQLRAHSQVFESRRGVRTEALRPSLC